MIINPNWYFVDAVNRQLQVASAGAAGSLSKSIIFSQQLGDEATADDDFSGFDKNVGLMLRFLYEDFMGLESAS